MCLSEAKGMNINMKILVVNTVPFEINGISAVIMNYYRNMNHDIMKMDFVSYGKIEQIYEKQIKKNGDRVFILCHRKKDHFHIY